jgi:hypothetical protein
MFLGIKNLVRPVSLGPGITGAGNDDTPLRPGIEDARKQGGTVLWCHNTFGFEDVPQALAGRLHALNVHDGSRKGSMEEGYYRYLNIGLRLPLSTGTDWFMYDFSRVYAKVEGELTPAAWLEALKAGRCVATNGPLLTLKVEGRGPGELVELAKPQSVKVEVTAAGRHDFGRLELVHNGKVVKSAASSADKGRYAARLAAEVRIEQGGWLAARIDAKAKNELDQVLFAHTSPVYLTVAGKGAFDVEAAQGLLKQVEEAQAAIRAQGRFSDPRAAARVQALYEQAARDLRDRINRRAP